MPLRPSTPLPAAWREALQREERGEKPLLADPLPERRLARLLAAFILAGLVFLVLPGTLLGVWNLLSISARHSVEAASAVWIQSHGQAQLFGWVGAFFLGISLYAVPKFRRGGTGGGPAAGLAMYGLQQIPPPAGVVEPVSLCRIRRYAGGAGSATGLRMAAAGVAPHPRGAGSNAGRTGSLDLLLSDRVGLQHTLSARVSGTGTARRARRPGGYGRVGAGSQRDAGRLRASRVRPARDGGARGLLVPAHLPPGAAPGQTDRRGSALSVVRARCFRLADRFRTAAPGRRFARPHRRLATRVHGGFPGHADLLSGPPHSAIVSEQPGVVEPAVDALGYGAADCWLHAARHRGAAGLLRFRTVRLAPAAGFRVHRTDRGVAVRLEPGAHFVLSHARLDRGAERA